MLVKITARAWNVDERRRGAFLAAPVWNASPLAGYGWDINRNKASQVHKQSTGISLVMAKGYLPATL